MITPKCTGSTPICLAMGRRIGVVMRISDDMSIKVPMKSRNRLMMSRTTIGSLEKENMACAISAGTLR